METIYKGSNKVNCVSELPYDGIDTKYCKEITYDSDASCFEQTKCTDREWAYYPYLVGNIFEANPLFFSFAPLGLFLCVIFFVALKRYCKKRKGKN